MQNESALQWLDWVAICVMLAASAAVGIYYRFTGGKQKTAEEYFTADRSSGVLLLSFAMMVAFLSAISLLGLSGENYSYGVQFNLLYVGLIIGTPIVAYVYLPIFYELQTMSVFEYLEKRFGMTARLVASIANFLQVGFYTGVVIYAPSLALEATTGLNGTLSTLLIGLICTFYSTIGGIKAVIITDLIQGALMYVCVLSVLIIGIGQIDGGLVGVFNIASEKERLNFFDFDFDPTIRHTWWSLTIGGTFFFLSLYACSQVQVQRMLTASSITAARKALFLNIPLTLSMVMLVSLSGLVLFAYYNNCDPVTIGKIKSYDMVMPYFAKEKMTNIPGLTGIFVSGVFSASLSTVSAMLNSMAAIALSDYLKPLYKKLNKPFPDDKAASYGKILALGIGVLTLGVAFLASKLGTLIQLALGIHGAIGGPILGLFTLGMVFESANETGAVIGTVMALVINAIMTFGPKIKAPVLPMFIDGCINSTIITPIIYPSKNDDKYFYLFRISYLWATPIGLFLTLLFGYIASSIVQKYTKTPAPISDPRLFTPFIAARIKRKRQIQQQQQQGNPIGSQIFVLDNKETNPVEQ